MPTENNDENVHSLDNELEIEVDEETENKMTIGRGCLMFVAFLFAIFLSSFIKVALKRWFDF